MLILGMIVKLLDLNLVELRKQQALGLGKLFGSRNKEEKANKKSL